MIKKEAIKVGIEVDVINPETKALRFRGKVKEMLTDGAIVSELSAYNHSNWFVSYSDLKAVKA